MFTVDKNFKFIKFLLRENIVMNKIQLTAVTVVLLFVQFLLLQMVHAEELYPVQVNYQPTKVKISNLNVKNEQGMIVISGVIKRRSYNSHALPGHLDVQVLDNQNEVSQQGIIKVSGLNLRRNRNGRQFRISLDNELPEGSYIKLGWHDNQKLSSNHHLKQSSLL
jgi:hypothetical protein